MRSALHWVFAGFVLISGCGTSDSPIKGQSKTPKPTPPNENLLTEQVSAKYLLTDSMFLPGHLLTESVYTKYLLTESVVLPPPPRADA